MSVGYFIIVWFPELSIPADVTEFTVSYTIEYGLRVHSTIFLDDRSNENSSRHITAWRRYHRLLNLTCTSFPLRVLILRRRNMYMSLKFLVEGTYASVDNVDKKTISGPQTVVILRTYAEYMDPLQMNKSPIVVFISRCR